MKIELGQPVIVSGNYQTNQRGRVVKIGRVWIVVEIETNWDHKPQYKFRLDNQKDGTDGPTQRRFYTLASRGSTSTTTRRGPAGRSSSPRSSVERSTLPARTARG